MLDIETAPNLGYFWGLWEQNITPDKIVDSSYILCWAAKWLGEKEIMHDSIYRSSERKMLKGVHRLLDQTDVVVHYNGRSFDIPTLNKEFLINKMGPPAPYKQVDMLRVTKGTFRFQSNKLDHVLKTLKLGGKVKHEGFGLWVSCMDMQPDAWERMEAYNKGDVIGLERLYMEMRPWIKGHPNHGSYDGRTQCPHCSDGRLQKRGVAVTLDTRYQRYQCAGCGAWSRDKKPLSRAKTSVVGLGS